MIKPIIYLTNLYKYTCGDLIYKEITLPIDPMELEKIEKDLLKYGGEELFISDSNFDISEYANYKKYNEVFTYALENNQLEDALYLLKENSCPSIDEIKDTLESRNYVLIEAKDLDELGRYVVDNDLIENSFKIKEVINFLQDSYIDFTQIGQDYEINNGLTNLKENIYVGIY